MNCKNIARALATLAFLVGSASLLSTAHAEYVVTIDCHGTGDVPNWAGTSNQIKIQIWFQNTLKDTWTWDAPSVCGSEDTYAIAFSNARYAAGITQIRVSTNGSNTFWIDKLTVSTTRDMTLVDGWPIDGGYRWGVDNTLGYCLSTTASDGNISSCLDSTAHTSIDFFRN